MEKRILLLIPLLAGLFLVFFSWYCIYPLSITSPDELIYTQIPIIYWIGLSILFVSTYLIALFVKTEYIKWIMTISFVFTLYSIWFFYSTVPTSDSIFFRAVSEKFLNTNSLDISQSFLAYYQWPSFFIIAGVVTSVTGLNLVTYEFLMLGVIIVLLSTALYNYASGLSKENAFITGVAFFVIAYNFINFQVVPFTLAFALLCLLFSLDVKKTNQSQALSSNRSIVMLLLYASITLTHVFVPLFFIIYLLFRSLFNRKYLRLFALTLIIYLVIQITLGSFSFGINIIQVFTISSEFSNIVAMTFTPVHVMIDIFAQLFTRVTTIIFGSLSLLGFLVLIVKKQVRHSDKAILITGIVYSCLGVVLFTLGSRAIPLTVIPISLGMIYFYRSKFGSYVKYPLVIVMMLLVFIPFHSTFNDYPINYQTEEDFKTANFMIEKHNWDSVSTIIADSGTKWYIAPQVASETNIDTNFESRFGLSNLTNYDYIIYSIGLEKALHMNNISITQTSSEIQNQFNILFNSGNSYIAQSNK